MRSRLRSEILRTALSMTAVSVWMLLLFSGWIFGGAVHLLFALALVLFPWRWLAIPVDSPTEKD